MENNKEKDITYIFYIIALILGAIFLAYYYFGCNMHVSYYDNKISEMSTKIIAISCDVDTGDARCRELYYERNKLIQKRNNLMCVSGNTNPLSVAYKSK